MRWNFWFVTDCNRADHHPGSSDKKTSGSAWTVRNTMRNGTAKYHFEEPIKSIAIIGAGISSFVTLTQGATGIVLAKAARIEGFTSIKIFEQRSDIGGAWYLVNRDKLINKGCILQKRVSHLEFLSPMLSPWTRLFQAPHPPIFRPCTPIFGLTRRGMS
jgi:hypothetical protein